MFEEVENNDKKHSVAFTILGIFVMIATIAGVSIAAYTWQFASDKASSISTGNISMSLLESSDSIDITNAIPIKDSTGKTQAKKFDFAVTTYASGKAGSINYNLSITKLDVDSGYTALSDSSVKVYLTALTESGEVQVVAPTLISSVITSGGSGTLNFDSDKTNYLTHSHDSADSSITTKYRLRMWVADGVDASSWTDSTKNQYKLKISASGALSS